MAKTRPPLLAKEHLEHQISQIDLLMAMYPSDDEITIDAETRSWVSVLRDYIANLGDIGEESVVNAAPTALLFEINVSIESAQYEEQRGHMSVVLSIDVPLRVVGHESAETNVSDAGQPPTIKVRLRQPPWMNRSQASQLNASIPSEFADDIFTTIEWIREEATRQSSRLSCSSNITTTTSNDTISTSSITNAIISSQPAIPLNLVRVWFYLPTLSTRSKRNDMVKHASSYQLTGFVLAGKPSILCLEGLSEKIDEYMSFIKTHSWSDVPSHQKKVSERYREALGAAEHRRVFGDMQEITDADFMGEKRGERGNRNDLRALEGWLGQKGLGDVFAKVLL